MCSRLVPSRGLCRIFAYRTRHTQCVARLFLRMACGRSLLIERGIHTQCVARLFLRVAYVGSLLIERGIQCVAGLFLRMAINIINEMRFPLGNSVCRVETTCPLVRLDNLVAVPSKLMRCVFHSTTPTVESRQLVRSYKL